MPGSFFPATPNNVCYVNGEYGNFPALVSDLRYTDASGTLLPTFDMPAIYKPGVLNIPCVVVAQPDALQNGRITQPNSAAYTLGVLEVISTRVSLGCLIYNLSVHGEDAAGDAAIAKWDRLYIDTDGELNADRVNGIFFGWALAAVGSGSTTKIPVKIAASGDKGSGSSAGLGDGNALAFSGATGTATIGDLWYRFTSIICSNNGVCALAIPGASNFPNGTRIRVKKTGTAGAVTITPAAGTIDGASSVNSQDAQNDLSEYIAVGADWARSYNVIA